MRILLIAADLSQGGGVNKVIADLANLFSERCGYDVTVLNGRSRAKSRYEISTFVNVIPAENTGKSVSAYFSNLWACRSGHFEIALSFWTQDNILTALAFCRSGTRVIVCEHISHFHAVKMVSWLRVAIYRWVDGIVVVNSAEEAHYQQSNRVHLIPNPIQVPADASRPGGEREKLILGVGHLVAHKGFADLIAAFDKSHLASAGWRLSLIGEGPLKGDLLRQVAYSGCAHAVEIVPFTPNIGEFYAKASLIVVASSVEVFSLVLAEAMAHGVIPIAYATDGPAYILADFPDQLVTIGDIDALASRLSVVAATQHQDLALRGKLEESIAARFAPQAIARRWVNLFSEVVPAR